MKSLAAVCAWCVRAWASLLSSNKVRKPSQLYQMSENLKLPACGGVYDATEAGYITSPGYPLEYPPHQNCHWIITVPEPSQRIVLNFNPHFEIERLDCKHGCVREQRFLHVFTVLCEGRGAAEVEGSPSWSRLRICMTAGTAEKPEL
ncbi:Neuropilin-2, partial [Dissostichus eleginoides]